MQWKHIETKKPAVMTSETPILETSKEIKEWEDLPLTEFWEQVNMPPEIVAMGRSSINSFIRAFFEYSPVSYYLTIFPSGFPNGEVPD